MRTALSLIFGILAAFILSISILIIALNPPLADIQQLFVLMVGTGSTTVGLTLLLRRLGVFQRFTGLRIALLVTIMVMALLIFVNVWLVAQLMFISKHDLVLTTSLLVFASGVGTIATWIVAQPIIERIRNIAVGADRLSKGDLNVQLPIQGRDELAQLTQQFNQMAKALRSVEEQKRQLEQSRRDLIASVSHDLRTPLTAIRVMHEAILDGVVSDTETITRYIRNSQREVEHLSRLIDDLFTLTRIELGQLSLDRENISLRDLISDTLGSLTVQARQKKVDLSGSVDDRVDTVHVAPDKIQRVLYNLLDNALCHVPPHGRIELRAEPIPDHVRISIFNTGSAIAPTELGHVFERFYQVEPSRTQTTESRRGAGLGLAIARGFVEAHGGHIWAESQPEKGTTFIFTLPLN